MLPGVGTEPLPAPSSSIPFVFAVLGYFNLEEREERRTHPRYPGFDHVCHTLKDSNEKSVKNFFGWKEKKAQRARDELPHGRQPQDRLQVSPVL